MFKRWSDVRLRWEPEDNNTSNRYVACIWFELPDVGSLIETMIQRLGETARQLWPHWYGVTLPQTNQSTDLITALRHSSWSDNERAEALMLPWLQAAAARCLRGQMPMPAGFTDAANLRQLTYAIARDTIEFILCIESPLTPPESLYRLARAAEWIAKETGHTVSVLVPCQLANAPKLDNISFSRLEPVRAAPVPAANHDREDEEKTACVIWPIQGHPHPNSPGEQLLARHLNEDATLGGLFEFNLKLQTVLQHTFQVDLVWRAGKVVVEVDGYHFHSGATAFNRDRQRDYELLISGYLTLRLPHAEVIDDIETSVRKVRDVVRFRRCELLSS